MTRLKQITLLSLLMVNTNLLANKIVGALEPYSTTIIKSQITGVIDTINYSIGDNIQKGDLLIKIDDKDYVLEYKMAKANEKLSKINYDFLKSDFKRYNNLLKSKSITTQVHANKKKSFQLAQLENDISLISSQQAKRKLNKTKINAVYSGVISDKFVEIGDYVSSGDTLLELVNDEKLKAVFYILQEDYGNFEKGNELNLIIPDLKHKKTTGKIHLISPTITGNNNGYRMEVVLDNSNKELKSDFEIELLLEKEE